MNLVNKLSKVLGLRAVKNKSEERLKERKELQSTLMIRSCEAKIYVLHKVEPLTINFVASDRIGLLDNYVSRTASDQTLFDNNMSKRLKCFHNDGVLQDNVWYPPGSIIRVELKYGELLPLLYKEETK
jgi:hypothetical protein